MIKGDICTVAWYNPKVHRKDMVFVVESSVRTKGPFLGNEIITYIIYPYRDKDMRWHDYIYDIPESILRKPTKQERFIYLMDQELLKKNEDF